MKKIYIFLILIIVAVFVASFGRKSDQNKNYKPSKQIITPTTAEPTPYFEEPINWNRMHIIGTFTANENIGPESFLKKGTYKVEQWQNRLESKYRFEMYNPDGTLHHMYITDNTGTRDFKFDPKTKKGKFGAPYNVGAIQPEEATSAKESFEIRTKLIKNEYHPDEKLEEVKEDGRDAYKITSYFGDGTIRSVTFIDKQTYLTYKDMSSNGKKFIQISRYNYLSDDFSDEVFSSQPPKGYTIAN